VNLPFFDTKGETGISPTLGSPACIASEAIVVDGKLITIYLY